MSKTIKITITEDHWLAKLIREMQVRKQEIREKLDKKVRNTKEESKTIE